MTDEQPPVAPDNTTPPTGGIHKKPSLAEVTKNLPEATSKTIAARATGLKKSIIHQVHPLSLVARGAQKIHETLSDELPEVGMLIGGLAEIGHEISDRAHNKKPAGMSSEEYKFEQMYGKPMPESMKKSSGTGMGGKADSKVVSALDAITLHTKTTAAQTSQDSPIVGILRAMGGSMAKMGAEIKALTNITSKVWGINKDELQVTRDQLAHEIEADRDSKFEQQENGDASASPDLKSSFTNAAASDDPSVALSKSLGTKLKDMVVGTVKGIGKTLIDNVLPMGMMAKYLKGNEGNASKMVKAGGAVAAGDEASLAAKAATKGFGLIDGALVGTLVISMLVGAIKGALKSNLFKNFDAILAHAKTVYDKENLVDAIGDFLDKANMKNFFLQIILGIGKTVGDVMLDIAKFAIRDGLALIQKMTNLIPSMVLGLIDHLPVPDAWKEKLHAKLKAWEDANSIDKLGGVAADKLDAWQQGKDKDISGFVKTASDAGDEQAKADGVQEGPSAPPEHGWDTAYPHKKMIMTPPPSANTQTAASIDVGSQQYGSAITAAQMAPLSQQSSSTAPTIVNAPTTNNSSVVQSFTNGSGRSNPISSQIYGANGNVRW
jgi:hypothetical protein